MANIRLLILTQTLDREDPYLGFFHDWVAALAPRFARIEVICLTEGKHSLPDNVRVHTLGKERGRRSRVVTAAAFISRLWELRGAYDAVFVHMNPEYVMLGGVYWKLLQKPVALWYNHEQGGAMLSIAAHLVRYVFHTSPYAASAHFPNSRKMPVGIDTELFRPTDIARAPGSIYFQGRVAPKKRVHVLMQAVELLHKEGKQVSLTIVGPEDTLYVKGLRDRFAGLIEEGVVRFLGPKRLPDTPTLFSANDVAVNLTAAGNFDKTGLEALACGTLLIASSPAYADFIPAECRFEEGNARSLADSLARVLSWPEENRAAAAEAGREKVEKEHSLRALVEALARAYGASSDILSP